MSSNPPLARDLGLMMLGVSKKQFTLESVRCRIFRILHQSMHPTATPWRLHGSVSRRSCVQMPSMQCGCFWFCRFHQIWNIFCDGLGLKIINHDNHDGLCLGKSWKIKLGEFVSTPARVCCGFCAPSSRRTMWFWCGPWQTVWDFGGKLPSFECQYQGETSDDEGSLFHLCQLHAGQIRAVFHLGGISSTGSFDLEDRMCSFPPVFSWRLLHMGPKRKAIDPPDGFVGSFFNVSDRLTAWEIPDTWRRPTARLPPKLWSAKGPFFLHRNFAVNQLVSGKIFTGNIQKHPETMFFSKPWFQASADPPEAFRVVRPSECQMISDDHKINPFYGNLESMDLKWLEYVGVYRWQPPQMWIGVDHGWRFFQAVAVDHLQLLWPLPAFGTASLHKRQLHVVNPGCHKPTLTVGWFMALGLPDYLKSELFHCLPEQRWARSHSKRWSFKGSICAPHEKCGYGTLAVNTPPKFEVGLFSPIQL